LNINSGGTMTVGNSLIIWTNDSVNMLGGALSPAGGVQNLNGFLNISAGALSTPASIQNTGTINLTGGTLTADSINNTGTINFTGGTLHANTILNSLTNNGGTLSPGLSPGTTWIYGNYAQNSPGRLQIELASPTSYDKLVVSGNLAISGAYLDVTTLGDYTPSAGAVFDILDWGSLSLIGGGFNIQLPSLNAGLVWNTSLLYANGVLSVELAGDFNHDHVVNAADYVAWRKYDGTPAGYNMWRANFGNLSGSGMSSNMTVPEPTTGLLLLIAGTLTMRSRRRRAVA